LTAALTKDAKLTTSANGGADDRVKEMETELGIWLSSINSFLTSGPSAFHATNSPDRTREAHIVHSALLRSAMLTAMLLDPLSNGAARSADVRELARTLRDLMMIVEPALRHKQMSNAEFNALKTTIAERLGGLEATNELIATADAQGSKNLPAVLLKVTDTFELNTEHAELALVLPRFGRVLRYLDVVGGMLERDEPLKPSILVFSRVNEMIHELTAFINNRLERFPDAEAEMFATLDAASYTASMELKKVYAQELAGVMELRPAPSIYARTETAYALLHDGFQLILAGFAQIVDPSADIFTVFPEFKIKREQSLELRRELDALINAVESAETEPEESKVEVLKSDIREFMLEPATYLFSKDTETVERFVEEITSTRSSSDLIPLLHRFRAYLDTLLGQVSLRAVLAEQ
jgi:hypothetical protein